MADINLEWIAHTPNLLQEVLNNPGTEMLKIPLQIFGALLYQVAERASELNDPQLNTLMARLTLYEVADPRSEHFDREVVMRLLRGTEHEEKN